VTASARTRLILGAVFFALCGPGFSGCRKPPPAELLIYEFPLAESSNPLEFDYGTNVQFIGSVRAGLIDEGRKGSIRGVLAESWEASEDYREWKFRFRSGMKFETGEEITPRHLVESWQWLAQGLRRSRSESGFLESLSGFAAPGPDGRIEGLSYDDSSITLRFEQPFPKLLAALGNAEFSVTHPRCRSADGTWACEREAVASGPYRIKKWTEHGIELVRRDDFPSDFRHPNAPAAIRFLNARKASGTPHLTFGVDAIREYDGLRFVGGANYVTGYADCASWSHPESPCRTREMRRILRDRFYRFLGPAKGYLKRSFFPLALKGIREGELSDGAGDAPVPGLRGDLRVQSMGPGADPYPLQAACRELTRSLGMKLVEIPVNARWLQEDLASGRDEYRYDVLYMSSQFNLDDPEGSVRSLFLAQRDMRFPDPTGRIRQEVAKEPLDFGRINDLIWEDAVIWPLGHAAEGVWASEDLDLSLYNTVAYAPPLHWLGFK
jgi:hypothetical protein